ncbi:MAG: 3-phosphoshikimate 1-carboxyvinyltransferase [Actinobacteria bacterium]|nr:3-phosphoshikimate 1-carboxyvinyltransferase [Actinomycetota bacterium]
MPLPVAAQSVRSVVVNLRNVELEQVAEQISRITGRTIVLDPNVGGRVSVVSSGPVSPAGAWELFRSVLRLQGYAAVRSGNVWRIVPQAQAVQSGSAGAASGSVRGQEVVTRLIRLQSLPSAEAVRILRPLVASFGSIEASTRPNAVVVTDYAENVRRIERLARSLDGSGGGATNFQSISLSYANAAEVGESIQRILGDEAAGGPRVAVDERSNMILVRGSRSAIAEARRIAGTLEAPADKSISHRAALLGAMSLQPVRVSNYLQAADTLSTLNALRAVGARVERHEDAVVVRGTGLREAREPGGPIDVGNAGTLMRLLPGWLAAQEGRIFVLDGDSSIRRRPVDRIAAPLALMGAQIEAKDGRFAPFVVYGTRLHAIDYELPVASAQVKSCVLLAGIGADGTTSVVEPAPSRDHTERMLAGAGVAVQRDGLTVSVTCTDELAAQSLVVPGDLSSAAFMIAAGVLVRGSRLLVRDVGVNWTRTGFLRILERMGAIAIGELEEPSSVVAQSEPVSDIDVAAGPLQGTVIEPDEVPLAIDELPLVALLGCFAEGDTIVRGAQELRVKESDRIAGVVDGLRGLGATIEATQDGFAVSGGGGRPLRGGVIDAHGDHRMAMLGAVAGLASAEGVEVVGIEAAAVSYPGFAEDLARLA